MVSPPGGAGAMPGHLAKRPETPPLIQLASALAPPGQPVQTERETVTTSATEVPGADLVPGSTDAQLRRFIENGLYDPDLDFRKLLAEGGGEAFWSQGFRLVSKEDLLGVPFVIISATYREGFPRAGVKGDYVSIEAVVADADILSSKPVMTHIAHEQPGVSTMSDLSVFPNEAIIFNDGSTGVRRQVTEKLAGAGIFDPGPDGPDVLDRHDRQIQKWKKGADLIGERNVALVNGEPFRYVCRRGLRKSEYENEFGQAVTFYIA
jgi:hypothetical protein